MTDWFGLPTKVALITGSVLDYTTASYFVDVFKKEAIAFEVFKPDEQHLIPQGFDWYLFVDDGTHYPILPNGSVLKVLFLIDTHMGIEEDLIMAAMADVVFCAQKNAVSSLRKVCPATHWLPLACSPDVHFQPSQLKSHDVAFIGGVADARRAEILRTLAEKFPCSFIGRAPRNEIGKIYSAAKIVVNVAVNNDINMRFFEGLCSGALLLTDTIKENGMEALLGNGPPPCVFYSEVEDLVEKAVFYLAQEQERLEIAQRGRSFALRNTYLDRWFSIVKQVDGAEIRKLPKWCIFYADIRLKIMAIKRRLKKGVGHD